VRIRGGEQSAYRCHVSQTTATTKASINNARGDMSVASPRLAPLALIKVHVYSFEFNRSIEALR
jgi:hypothetical protein